MLSLRMLAAAQFDYDDIERSEERTNPHISLESTHNMSDVEFIQHFRLNKTTFRMLCDDLKQSTLLKGTKQYPVEIKVLTTLSFLATGSYQRLVGGNHQITQRTTSRFMAEVVDAMISPGFANKWVKFPDNPRDRNVLKQEFQRMYKIPGVVGCVDCTHIAIVRPERDEHAFYNRKGYHSLNVQMVCDVNLRILNVNTRFGGASHDSHIWSSSRMETFMRELHRNQEYVWLLGDSGYAQRPWMMVPILNAITGSREDTYTRRHMQARNCIERCFGLLKSRWRCLLRHRTLHYEPQKAGKIVLACSVLHNIAIAARLQAPDIVNEGVHVDLNISMDDENQTELTQGRAFRTNLLTRLV